MCHLTDLVDRYLASWNEPDAVRRQELIRQTFSEAADYLDPLMQGEGADGIDAMIRGVQERFPGHSFRRLGTVDAHHDRIRFSWELTPEGGPALVKGTDFALLSSDQRLRSVTGFFDHVPA
jgi:hypothetical protein